MSTTTAESQSQRCYKHPKEETAVSCGRCDRPICPKCMIPGPAGMRCPDCAALRSSPLYRIAPGRLALAALVAIVVGTAGGMILFRTSFFILFISWYYGIIMAEAVLWATARKTGPTVTGLAVAGIVIGGLIASVPDATPSMPYLRTHVAELIPDILALGVWPLIGVGIAICAAVNRLK